VIKSNHPDAEVEIAHVDISDEALVNSIYQSATERFGRVDFAANIAGYATLDSKMYDLSYKVNQHGVSGSLLSSSKSILTPNHP
jgi:NAD(P)-dependent dehydrogenase (short-subunit alcohol dehydrogenase family)